MSDYKCINPFYSQTMTKRYSYGELITSSHYNSLPPSERDNFRREYNNDSISFSNSSSLSSDSSWLSSPDTSSSDWSLGSDSGSYNDSSSFDFGGGDTGGGGASGDW